jgi:hypothetical protein
VGLEAATSSGGWGGGVGSVRSLAIGFRVDGIEAGGCYFYV